MLENYILNAGNPFQCTISDLSSSNNYSVHLIVNQNYSIILILCLFINYSIVNRVSKYMYKTKCVGAVLFSLNSELWRPRSDCMALQADPRLRSSRTCINLQSMTDKTELNIVIGISKSPRVILATNQRLPNTRSLVYL